MTIVTKPAYGSPCNGCGVCCRSSLCPLALHIFGGEESRSCPALESDGPKSVCGLVASPLKYVSGQPEEKLREAALLLIGSGHGCDAKFPWEHNPEYDARLRRLATEAPSKTKRAKRTWGA